MKKQSSCTGNIECGADKQELKIRIKLDNEAREKLMHVLNGSKKQDNKRRKR